MVEPKLQELDAAEVMDIRGMSFHFPQFKVDFSLRDHLLFVRPDNLRFLPEFARAATPARPDT